MRIMNRNEVLELIKAHKEELERFDFDALFLFGSFAREEENIESDIDILVKFKGAPNFDQYMELKFFLEDLTGRKVNLVTDSGLRPEIRSYVEKDLIRAA